MKYGSWTVIEVLKGNKDNDWQTKWRCRCDCGEEKIQHPSNLRSGRSTACKKCSPGRVSHRLYKHPLYAVWTATKQRVLNPDHPSYENYGGRGIKMWESWVDDPQLFITWCIENGWKRGLQLDRRDNEGDYTPDNCRFVTQQENLRNKRTIQTTNTSGFRGVCKTPSGRWRAVVGYKHVSYVVGTFDTALQAAISRDRFCREHNFDLPMNFTDEELKQHE